MSASTIAWLLSLLLVIIVAGGFAVGFWRGLRKSAINAGISIAGLLLAFFITPFISNGVMNITVPYGNKQTRLSNLIYEAIASNKDIASIIDKNPNLKIVFENLPKAIISSIIFILFTIAIEIVVYCIYKIFGIVFFKKDHKGRVLGGVIGAVKTFLITIIAFMPFAGFIGFADTLIQKNDYGIVTTVNIQDKKKHNGLIGDNLPSDINPIVNGLQNNLLTWCSSVFGLDNAMFDYYADINTKEVYIHTREELTDFYKLADFAYQLSSYDLSKIDYTKIDYTKLTAITKSVTSSQLCTKIILPAVNEVIIDYKSYSFIKVPTGYEEILDKIGQHISTLKDGSSYLKDDINSLVSSAKVLGKNGVINELIDSRNSSLLGIAQTLIDERYFDSLISAVDNTLKMNVTKDSFSVVAQKILDSQSNNFDDIGVESNKLNNEEWNDVSDSFINMIKIFKDLCENIDIDVVIKQPSVLLKDDNYDISYICGKVGEFIDEVRSNRLLQTAENEGVKKPIVDKFLAAKKLNLPEDELITNDGKSIKVSTYKELFNFITPSLEKVKSEKLYNIIDEKENVVIKIADIISQEGKSNLLSEIILPLYQIDFIKTNINKLSQNIGNEFINLDELKNYDDWKNDLNYISNFLIALNNPDNKVDGKSFLKLALDEEYEKIVDNVREEDVYNIVFNLVNAKSTKGLKEKMFDAIEDQIKDYTGNIIEFNTECDLITDGQIQEICNIVKKDVVFRKSFTGGSFQDANLEYLGEFLNSIKLNAYRDVLSGKEESGIFKEAFVCLVNKLKTDFSEEIELALSSGKFEELFGVADFSEDNYSKLDYVTLLTELQKLKGNIAV